MPNVMAPPNAAAAIAYALRQRGKPYVWGATGPDTFDCSGLMVKAYQVGDGITLPRTTQAMLASKSLMAVTAQQLKPGDLVFPSSEHVQMYLGGGMVVEAPHTGATVRVARLGTVMAARRVTTPASGDWSTASPVSAAESVSVPVVGSVVAQGIGTGFTHFIGSALSKVFSWAWYVFEVLLGTLSIVFGITLITKVIIGTVTSSN